jgi:hypothetical protein
MYYIVREAREDGPGGLGRDIAVNTYLCYVDHSLLWIAERVPGLG